MDLTNPVISIAILLAAALVGGMVAHRLRQPVILGYLIVGVVVGPHALGLVGDKGLVEAGATIGVALLMFTLGLEVSGHQLKQVGKVGLWGGIAQIGMTAAIGLAAGFALFGWSLSQAFLFGLIISLSSTAVCLKVLMDRGELDSVHGRIMMGILILQDISVVAMMVVVPLLGSTPQAIPMALAVALGEALLAVGLAIVSGVWVLPWLMGRVGGIRARELFLLTVLVLSLGAALATQVFGLSAVFGAFLIGLVLHETRFVHQALAEITPLRDIFATLFFVSLGMLASPSFIIENWSSVLAVVGAILVIKFLVVFGIIRLFGYGGRIAFLAGSGLLQVGEFGFILAQAGIGAGLISEQFYSLILTSAIMTMLLTPISISLAAWSYPRLARLPGRRAISPRPALPEAAPSRLPERVAPAEHGKIGQAIARPYSWLARLLRSPATPTSPEASPSPLSERVVLAGYGRTGQNIAKGLQDAGIPYIVVDIDPDRIEQARSNGIPRIYGDACNPVVLSHVDLNRARMLVVTFPDPTAVVSTVRCALQINPKLRVVARVHRAREADMLKDMGVTELVNPEYEASLQFLKRVLETTGKKESEFEKIVSTAEEKGEFIQFDLEEATYWGRGESNEQN
ncbi:MAG: cation:proton antiporter [Chloroflexi bacterium]|nr:cation:proton antiporter [Chloroflexota bacterium]